MTADDVYPGVVPAGTNYLEAVVAEEHARNHARAIRALAADSTPPRRGWIARLEWVARVNGLRAAAHLMDTHATAYRLHATQIKDAAK